MPGTLDLLVRLAVSMAVVMVVMGLAARLLRRRANGGWPRGTLLGRASRATGPQGPQLEVVHRRPLAKGSSVALVNAAGRSYLLGVTERSVTLLASLPGPAGPQGAPGGQGAPGRSVSPVRTGNPASGPTAELGGRGGKLAGRTGDLTAAPGDLPGPAGDLLGPALDLPGPLGHEDGRKPSSLAALRPATAGQGQPNAWKLAIDSLRERTVRR